VENRTKTYHPLTAHEAAVLAPGLAAVPIGSRAGVVGYAVVDAADFDMVAAHAWNLSGRPQRLYPRTGPGIHMHRLILGLLPGDGVIVDHRNGNQFWNTRENLLVADQFANMHNRAAFVTSQTGIKGVSPNKCGLWHATLTVRGERVLSSYHKDINAAIDARKQAERTHGITNGVNP
jgi:hypothetical protein